MSPLTADSWKQKGKSYHYRESKNVFFVDEGKGPALVLIHGFPTSSYDWSYIWHGFPDYRKIAPDLMGFGFSDKPRNYHYSISDQANLIEGLLESLNVREYHILAHDYGDTVAQELLARQWMRTKRNEPGLETSIQDTESWDDSDRQSRILSVCFLNGGLFPEVHRPRFIQKLLISPLGPLVSRLINQRKFEKSFSEIFGPETRPSQEELQTFWDLIQYNDGVKIYHRLIRYMDERKQFRKRWVDPLIESDVPIRVINGPEDPVSGRHMAEHYRKLVSHPDIVYLDGIGHYPQTENPEGVIRHYLEFRRSL
ncbi:MAG TPA: alpha/beta hydrolase [Leptospiraceae bacterium]|nr:alpha/beta hydrolase [Spirochaetaceae bacterium]HBS06702.1 alpha/beta hydrolase [Leptospiraceae bacterium]|tara:strand:- start:56993 stop:57925 length:933 start_codon:yes stop_codon:yes gene_type:complete